MEWMLLPLRRYARFGGRSQRKEYWMFALFTVILSIAANLVDHALGFGGASAYAGPGGAGFAARSNGPVGGLVSLALLIPSLAVSVRRLHDVDRSGWWLLLAFVPVLGWIALLVFACQDGTRGGNRFGADPKGGDLAEVFR